MKNYNLKHKKKNNYCVCSVLQAIFNRNNIKISQEEIANKLTPNEKGFYFDDNNFKNFMNKNNFNFEYYEYNKTPFNEPDSLLGDIVNNDGFIEIRNHTFLVFDFKDPTINYIDPLNSNKKEFNYYELIKEMHKINDGFFGLLKKLN